MSTSKPMSDGGKGSVRRNEDTEAYRNNWDNIFGAKAPKSSPTAAGQETEKDKEPMIEEHEEHYDEDDEEHICPACSGSGEGMYEGSTCYKCEGTGGWVNNQDDEIGECYDTDLD